MKKEEFTQALSLLTPPNSPLISLTQAHYIQPTHIYRCLRSVEIIFRFLHCDGELHILYFLRKLATYSHILPPYQLSQEEIINSIAFQQACIDNNLFATTVCQISGPQ